MSNILRIPPRRVPAATSKMDLDMPQIMTINQAGAPSSEPDFEEEYVEYASDEEEVDQIIDDDPPPTPRKANGKAKSKATSNNLTPSTTPDPVELLLAKTKLQNALPSLLPRKPGETHVDQLRVEKIIKAHGDLLPPSKDAVFLISLAVEEFVKRLANLGLQYSLTRSGTSIQQCDMARAAQVNYAYLQETVPTAIPLSLALQKHAQKENERMLIATELIQLPHLISNGTSAPSHKKRQPALPRPLNAKAKTRTSARHANGRSSTANVSVASTSASASASASAAPPVPDIHSTNSPRPKRAAAQKGRGSWAEADDDDTEYDEEEPVYATPMSVDDPLVWRAPPRQSLPSANTGRGGIMKGFGPGAYAKVSGIPGRTGSGSPPHGRNAWGFPPEPPRNTGRTIYSDRGDEAARKAAVELEEQLRYKRARQKIEQELMTQDAAEPPPEWTSDNKD